jgi:integrase
MEKILEQEGIASGGSSFRRVGECLYQNPSSGTYYAVVRLNGKQFKSSLETKSLPEARRKLRDYRNDLNRLDPGLARLTIRELCDKYLSTIKHQAAGTVRQKKEICGRIKKQWGEVRARDLKKSEILKWLSSFAFGAHSYNKYLRTIRAVLALAVDDRILSASPLDGVKEVRTPKPIRQTPSFAEFQAIIGSIRAQGLGHSDESADLAEFMGFAGLGQAETSSLTWDDVHLEKGQIVTFRHKTKQGFAIPIFPQLRPLLEKRWTLAIAANAGNPPPVGTKVFSVLDARRAIEAACERLKLPHYTSRSFRRLFITTAIERGVDVKVIAQWQGHRDGGKLILDTYSHVRPVHSEQMARLMTLEPVTK